MNTHPDPGSFSRVRGPSPLQPGSLLRLHQQRQLGPPLPPAVRQPPGLLLLRLVHPQGRQEDLLLLQGRGRAIRGRHHTEELPRRPSHLQGRQHEYGQCVVHSSIKTNLPLPPPLQCLSPIPKACTKRDIAYQGNDILVVHSITSATRCQGLCINHPNCTFFTLDSGINVCHLKWGNASQNVVPKLAHFSGPAICPIPNNTVFGTSMPKEGIFEVTMALTMMKGMLRNRMF